MNRLQKKAWSSLITITICSLICLVCFSFMVARNAKGADYLLICLVVGLPTGIAAMFQELRFQNQLDEREKMLYQNANQWSVGALTGYLLVFCFSVFFLVGGGGQAPVWLFPGMLFSGLFIAQATQSTIILFQCRREQDNA